jgi:hypothetical protein
MKLSSKLMDAVVNHPQLKSIDWIALCCLPEMIPYYERWGFTSKFSKIQLMFRINQSNKEIANDN